MKIFVVQMNSTIGDIAGNTQKIISGIWAARQLESDLVVFPEMVLTGYPPQDLCSVPILSKKHGMRL